MPRRWYEAAGRLEAAMRAEGGWRLGPGSLRGTGWGDSRAQAGAAAGHRGPWAGSGHRFHQVLRPHAVLSGSVRVTVGAPDPAQRPPSLRPPRGPCLCSAAGTSAAASGLCLGLERASP